MKESVIPQPPNIAHLDMYRLLGDREVLHTETYRRTAERTLSLLPGLITRYTEPSSSFFSSANRLAAVNLIRLLPAQQRYIYLDRYISDQYPAEVNAAATNQIDTLPEEQRERLLEKALNSTVEITAAAVKQIHILPEKRRTAYVKTFIKPDLPIDIKIAAIEQIPTIPEGKRTRLVRKCLGNNNSALIRNAAAQQVTSLPERERTNIITELMNDSLLSEIAIGQINTLPEGQKRKLLRNYLDTTQGNALIAGIKQLGELPEEERAAYIARFMDPSNNPDILIATIQQAYSLPEGERLGFLTPYAKSNIQFLREQAIAQTHTLPEGERLEFLTQCVNNGDAYVASSALLAVGALPASERAKFLRDCLTNNSLKSHPESVIRHMGTLSEKERQEIIDTFPDLFKSLRDLAGSTPLYGPGERRPFSTQPFSKNNSLFSSSITLLGDTYSPTTSFINRAFVRTMPALRYYTWKAAFEAADFWKSQGFDYVPVEPIIKANPNPKDDTQMDIATRVIPGPAIGILESDNGWFKSNIGWFSKTSLYKTEIATMKKKIELGLKKLGIVHGHPHYGNFVLEFDRNPDGQPNLARIPRVHVIDFDGAQLKK